MRQEILDEDVQLFQDLICKRSGIYLEGSRLDALRSELQSRMHSKGFAGPSQYYRFLHLHSEGQKELEHLLSYITINETYFFRNSAHFAVLKDHILAKHIKEKKEGIIRIWSAGCSTGEEPYSIAITALDLARDRKDLQIEILGTDVDKEALVRAERGIYKERSLRVTDEKIKERYFRANNGRFEIDEKLRNIVQFEYFNLMEVPYPKPSLGNWDIIFCRNVVIYFNQESLHRVVNNFHSVLANSGYLFMGHSETLTGISCGFSPVEIGDTFVYAKKPYNDAIARDNIPAYLERNPNLSSSPEGRVQKRQRRITESKAQDMRLETEGSLRSEVSGLKSQVEIEDAESIYRQASELHGSEQIDAALDKIEMYIQLRPEDPRGHLLAGRIYADRGIYKRSASEFEKSIELEPLLAEAHYLLGITYQRLGRETEAIDEFRKSIYIDRDCVLPYFSLACICQSKSRENDALREYNNAVRVLEKLPDNYIVPFSGGLTVQLLTQMCQRIIEQLSD